MLFEPLTGELTFESAGNRPDRRGGQRVRARVGVPASEDCSARVGQLTARQTKRMSGAFSSLPAPSVLSASTNPCRR